MYCVLKSCKISQRLQIFNLIATFKPLAVACRFLAKVNIKAFIEYKTDNYNTVINPQGRLVKKQFIIYRITNTELHRRANFQIVNLILID